MNVLKKNNNNNNKLENIYKTNRYFIYIQKIMHIKFIYNYSEINY